MYSYESVLEPTPMYINQIYIQKGIDTLSIRNEYLWYGTGDVDIICSILYLEASITLIDALNKNEVIAKLSGKKYINLDVTNKIDDKPILIAIIKSMFSSLELTWESGVPISFVNEREELDYDAGADLILNDLQSFGLYP
jgi:hypothetical protein